MANARGVVLLALALTGCSVDVPLAGLKPAIVGELKDPAVLTTLCGRPITQSDANQAGMLLTISDLVAKRGFFSKQGKATASVNYAAPSGGPCTGKIAFDFRDVGTMQQHGRRNVSYSSAFELTNFVASK